MSLLFGSNPEEDLYYARDSADKACKQLASLNDTHSKLIAILVPDYEQLRKDAFEVSVLRAENVRLAKEHREMNLKLATLALRLATSEAERKEKP